MNESSLRELRNLEKDKIADKAYIERQKKIIADSLLKSNLKDDLNKSKTKDSKFKKLLKKLMRVCS